MTLILSNDDIAKLLTVPECMEALEDAYRELANGRAVTGAGIDMQTPTSKADHLYSLKCMDGILPNRSIAAVRIKSDIVTWPKVGNTKRRVKVPAAPGGRYVGLVLLFSSETGEPLAIFPDGVMQRIRVGATNGLGVKYMARQNATSVGILGSGWQAGTQLAAAAAARSISKVLCFSPNAQNRRIFAAEMTAALGIAVTAVNTPEEAVSGADIVLCATSAIEPVFFERWVEPGMHISSIKGPEIEPTVFRRADRIAVHSHDGTPQHAVTKGLDVPGKSGKHSYDVSSLPTLPELITGTAVGRSGDAQVTCFLNAVGLGFQFAAAGAVVYAKARAAKLGHELPTDWFTELEHP
ncbi:MAG: ornithine cyclodeaminase family protein [Acidocella sp.]|nr:ornithine cyclodeaminase family protein [Acidocella sp.]